MKIKSILLAFLMLGMVNHAWSARVILTLGQGNITLKADYIEIRNSTTVPLGTTLTIEN